MLGFICASQSQLRLKARDQEMFVDFDRLSSVVWVFGFDRSLVSTIDSEWQLSACFKKSTSSAQHLSGSLWAEFIYECTLGVR